MNSSNRSRQALTAVIADDEPLLAESLKHALAAEWPEISIAAVAAHGLEAIEFVKQHKPDVVFLDIRMPGASGIEVAEAIAEDWIDYSPADSPVNTPPLIVFVTAFDDYAIQAFSASAVDYLLKPVKKDRLAKTVGRLKQRLKQQQANDIDQLSEQIRHLLHAEAAHTATTETQPPLTVIRASVGDEVRIIPVEDILLFESADKYVTVYTAEGESLIREPLRKLLNQLDQKQFAQIHRSVIVNMHCVEAAIRDDSGKVTLRLRGHSKQPTVSRLYRHLFQAM